MNIDVSSSGLAALGVDPPCSVNTGGSLVTISGTGFDSGAAVQFSGDVVNVYATDVFVRDPFTILARVPPAYGTPRQPQITVTNSDGSSTTLTNAFTYKWPADGPCSSPRRRPASH